MAKERETTSEEPSSTSGSELERDVDPNSPEHRDAGQVYVEENDEREREQESRKGSSS